MVLFMKSKLKEFIGGISNMISVGFFLHQKKMKFSLGEPLCSLRPCLLFRQVRVKAFFGKQNKKYSLRSKSLRTLSLKYASWSGGVCLLMTLMFSVYNTNAQSKDSLNRPDGVEVPQYHPEDSLGGLSDTSFAKNTINDNDTILKWKNSREFAYMHYLDSLLRKQKNLKSDTVSIDEGTGKINRNNRAEKDISALNQILNSLPFKIFFWALALIFIGFVSYKVLVKDGIFLRKKSKLIVEDGEEPVQDLDDLSKYDTFIWEAENSNDLNLATRYLFLKTLKNLSEREFISFSPDKTNKEYLHEMKTNNYHEEFESLTRNYEYVWYGKFLIDKNAYQQLKEKFSLFNKKV